MEKWREYFRKFYESRIYILLLAFTATCAYGFKIIHPTIGIDDTPHAYYFEEGLVAVVGRWVLFLLNKVLNIADFAPFLTDFAAVLILMAAVTVWAVLFYSVFGGEKTKYIFFSLIFISCPLICEVFTYYLHNGIAIGYLASGISLCLFREGLIQLKQKGKAIRLFAGSSVGLWIAMGCYESFMVVWILGVFLVLLSERFVGINRKVFSTLCLAAGVALAGIVLRSIMIVLVVKLFGLEYLQDEAVQRSVTEMVQWLFEPGALSEFAMVLKRIYVMYGVFAVSYYPIRIFLCAAAIIVIFSLWQAVKKKDIWMLLLMVGSFVAAFLLVVIEGKATLYRSAQFVPIICAYGIFLLCHACRMKKSRLLVFLLCCVVWNQCADMNKWFYVDYQKYEYAKETIENIAYELDKNFDTSKPVVFTGTYEVPQSIIGDAYVAYNTKEHNLMLKLTTWLDEHLLEKFYRSYGVWVAQTPSLSVIDWGRYAFDTDEELIKFFEMHGYELVPLLDSDYADAENYSLDLPSFPREGSIVDVGDYIIVHF